MICGKGGLIAHLGSNQASKVGRRALEGDEHCKLIYSAMAYQIGKEIGAKAAVLKGKVDAIIITGGIANDKMLVEYVVNMVEFIAPVEVFPGEDEMWALASNALAVLRGEAKCGNY